MDAAQRINPAIKARAEGLLRAAEHRAWCAVHGKPPPLPRLSPVIMRVIREWFELVDDDGSGTLEHHELAAALQAARIPCDTDSIGEMIKLMDANRDGVIGWGEFEAFLMQEFAAGKGLLSGEYMLPSGMALPFGVMVRQLKRSKMLSDVTKGGEARRRWLHYDIDLSEDARAVAEAEQAIQQEKAANESLLLLTTSAEAAGTHAPASRPRQSGLWAAAAAEAAPPATLGMHGGSHAPLCSPSGPPQAPDSAAAAVEAASRSRRARVPRLDLEGVSGGGGRQAPVSLGTASEQQRGAAAGSAAVASLAASLPATLRAALPSAERDAGVALSSRSLRVSGARHALQPQPCRDEWGTVAASSLARRHSSSLAGGTPRADSRGAVALRGALHEPVQQQPPLLPPPHSCGARGARSSTAPKTPCDVASSAVALLQQGGRGSMRSYCSELLRSARPSLPSQLLAQAYIGPVAAALALTHTARSARSGADASAAVEELSRAERGWCSARRPADEPAAAGGGAGRRQRQAASAAPAQLVLTNSGGMLVSSDGRVLAALTPPASGRSWGAAGSCGAGAGADAQATAKCASPGRGGAAAGSPRGTEGPEGAGAARNTSSAAGSCTATAAASGHSALAQQLVRPHSVLAGSPSGDGCMPRPAPAQQRSVPTSSFFLPVAAAAALGAVRCSTRASAAPTGTARGEAGAVPGPRRSAGCRSLGGRQPACAGGSHSPRRVAAAGGGGAAGSAAGALAARGAGSLSGSQVGVLLAGAVARLSDMPPGSGQLGALRPQPQARQPASPRLSYSGLSPRRVRL